jgi:hypothetical protein
LLLQTSGEDRSTGVGADDTTRFDKLDEHMGAPARLKPLSRMHEHFDIARRPGRVRDANQGCIIGGAIGDGR